jgi:uncharacterized RDD family membrane protein YckC
MSEPSGTQYGGFWIRLIALLADSAIVFMVCALLVAGAAVALQPELLPPVMLAAWALAFLYWPVMHASARQATFGKSLLGLKVARLHGGRISILRSLGRELSKVLSGMVFMLGYVMAAFTPRKQALHDLVGSTYVVREGVSRMVPALAVVVAGFALPVVVVPMIVGAALMSTMTSMAQAMVSQPDPMKQAAPKPKPRVQMAKAAPKPQPPAPEQKAAAPAPVLAAAPKTEPVAAPKPEPVAAPKPEPVAAAKPAAVPVAVLAKAEPKPAPVAMLESKPAEVAKPKAAKPKAERAKPEAAPTRVARPAPSVPAFEPKSAEGPKFNDLMTAVLYRDAAGVAELLKFGKWADKPDSRGVTPLMTAVELGDARTAEALLRGGANPKLAIPVAEERRDGEMILLLKRYSSR